MLNEQFSKHGLLMERKNNMKNVYKWFRKRFTNQYRAVDVKNGINVPMEYRREDLSKWTKEAFDNGKYYFYARPVNPNNPYGKLELCEPEFEYVLAHPLKQEELNELFGEEVYIDVNDYIINEMKAKPKNEISNETSTI